MTETRDIKDIDDLMELVTTFYTKVRADDNIGFIFNEVVSLDWEVHTEKISRFWESVLFGTSSYKGNPMLKHLELNKKTPLSTSHFDQWMKLWVETVDELFQGKKAEEAKSKADSLRNLMLYKIKGHSWHS